MQKIASHVGLDVHKNSITVAFVSRESGEVRSLGRVPNDLTRLLRTLEPLGEPGTVQVCNEAGPTGYGLYRELRERGYDRLVVATARTPGSSATGSRPTAATPEEEAMRDQIRTREDLEINGGLRVSCG